MLSAQGLTTHDCFSNFGKDELDIALKNMRTSVPGVPAVMEVLNDAGDVVVAASTVVQPVPPVAIPIKYTQRLEVASTVWNYYTDTSCVVTNKNIHYKNVLENFHRE